MAKKKGKGKAVAYTVAEVEFASGEETIRALRFNPPPPVIEPKEEPSPDILTASRNSLSWRCKPVLTFNNKSTRIIGKFKLPTPNYIGYWHTATMEIETWEGWTSGIRFEIKVHCTLPQVNIAAKAARDIPHAYSFSINSDSCFQEAAMIIHPYPKHRVWSASPAEKFYHRYALDDGPAQHARKQGQLVYIRFRFDPSKAHTEGIQVVAPPILPQDFKDLHATLGEIFEPAEPAVELDEGAAFDAGFATEEENPPVQEPQPKANEVTCEAFVIVEESVDILGRRMKTLLEKLKSDKVFPPYELFLRTGNPVKAKVTRGTAIPKDEERPHPRLQPRNTYRSQLEYFLINGLSMYQAFESQKITCKASSELPCQMRVLQFSPGGLGSYLAFIRLHPDFTYRLSDGESFKVKIGEELWTACMLRDRYQLAISTDLPITLLRPLTDTGFSQTQLLSVHDIRSLPPQSTVSEEKAIQDYLQFGKANQVFLRPTMNEESLKRRLGAMKAINPAHCGERGFVYNDRWAKILLGSDLRAHHAVDIFDGVNVLQLVETWGIKLDRTQQEALHYLTRLPNSFGIIDGPWGTGKTFLDVLVAMILISQGKKVLVVSTANRNADSFVVTLDENLKDLKSRGIDLLGAKEIVRVHSPIVEERVVKKEHQKHLPPGEIGPERRRWDETIIPRLQHDKLVSALVSKSRQTVNDIGDSRYQLHDFSLGTLLLRKTGLLNMVPGQNAASQTPDNPPASTAIQVHDNPSASTPSQVPDGSSASTPSQVPNVPSASTPSQVPDVPSTSTPSQVPDVPSTSTPSQVPDVPSTSTPSQVPDVPSTSTPSQVPDVPSTSTPNQVPDNPPTSTSTEVHDGPSTPTATQVEDNPSSATGGRCDAWGQPTDPNWQPPAEAEEGWSDAEEDLSEREDDYGHEDPDYDNSFEDGEGGQRYTQGNARRRPRENAEARLQRETEEWLNNLAKATGRAGLIEEFATLFRRLADGNKLTKKEMDQFKGLEKRITRDILENDVALVACTSDCAWSTTLRSYEAKHTIVQEAARVHNGELFIALARSKDPGSTIHCSGDSQQLGPFKEQTSDNNFAALTNVSTFQKLIEIGYPHPTLTTQRRTLQSLSQILSNRWYNGAVECVVDESSRPNIRRAQHTINLFTSGRVDSPIAFLDYQDSTVMKVGPMNSKRNERELAVVIGLACQMVDNGVPARDILLLTAYVAQARILQRAVGCTDKLEGAVVSTVDTFHGGESGVVILSITAVRSIGFLADSHRILTALSRAKDSIVLVGNWESFDKDHARRLKAWRLIKEDFEKAGLFTTITYDAPTLDFAAAEAAVHESVAETTVHESVEAAFEDGNLDTTNEAAETPAGVEAPEIPASDW